MSGKTTKSAFDVLRRYIRAHRRSDGRARDADGIDWLSRNVEAGIVASPWLTTDFASALARKVRLNELTVGRRDEAWVAHLRLTSQSLIVVPVEASHFRAAADSILSHASSLRAGDALHLAVAAANTATLATFDRKFAASAARLGYAVELLA